VIGALATRWRDTVNMSSNPHWLAADDWAWVQSTMPIACVDVLPVRLGRDGRSVERIGLIHRDTPHQGRRWCLVGGRLWRNEPFHAAAARQLRETLGLDLAFEPVAPDRQPDHVVQYFTTDRPDGLLDPRQHAVTLVFVVPIVGGEATPAGEALEFRWFAPDRLPPPAEWGFRQDQVAAACLKRMGGWYTQSAFRSGTP
jgi:ADP-ribose pyrophosphatase YjhB (NUDIX family)